MPEMEPMFLPGVEQSPQPGPYRDLIGMMRAKGGNTRRSGTCSRSCRRPLSTWPASRKRSCAARRL